ncbi:MAG: 6-phosphofructokinase [Bacteroidetes bacterium]|jgi:6-phosphofructokinase 1|nr:6-phosphofructokinase [Bacteroidota bacterium]
MRIGILTSGGDSPGMNACIRAVVKTALAPGTSCFGIRSGFQGLILNDIHPLGRDDVRYILHRGGTMLYSARCPDFMLPEKRQLAYQNLAKHGITGLVVIGGDGSFAGAQAMEKEAGIGVIGIPGTIDNDIVGTEMCLGFDTACQTAVDAIDKIRDTATSHHRLFLVEVMGRHSPAIALRCALATGALGVLVPGTHYDMAQLFAALSAAKARKKLSNIVVVAEGEETGGAALLAHHIGRHFPEYELRVAVLGHIQRGGSPSVTDRELGARMGALAAEALMDGKSGHMTAYVRGQVCLVPLDTAHTSKPAPNQDWIDLIAKLGA